ncbi:hypothetical protein [Weissella kandleri]|nr:hypothetical protein [Weissella kandleri]
MVGDEMHRENPVINQAMFYQLLGHAPLISTQFADDILRAIQAIQRQNGTLYLGRIHDSRIYRIGCNPNDEGFKLNFINFEMRNQFADGFEAYCRTADLKYYRYF